MGRKAGQRGRTDGHRREAGRERAKNTRTAGPKAHDVLSITNVLKVRHHRRIDVFILGGDEHRSGARQLQLTAPYTRACKVPVEDAHCEVEGRARELEPVMDSYQPVDQNLCACVCVRVCVCVCV